MASRPASLAALLALAALAAPGGCGLSTSGIAGGDEPTPCSTAAQCSDDNPCTVDACGSDKTCSHTSAPDGDAPEQVAGDCRRASCAGGVASSSEDPTDLPDDDNACTEDLCEAGVPAHTQLPTGTTCSIGTATGTCDTGGQCVVVCTAAAPTCDDGNGCTNDSCDVAASKCVFSPLDGVPVPGAPQPPGDCHVQLCISGDEQDTVDDTDVPDQLPGDCSVRTCAGGTPGSAIDDTDVLVDNNPCTKDLCAGGVPSNPPEPQSTGCGGVLVCDGAGQCVGCVTAADCPGQDDDCKVRLCSAQVCTWQYTGPSLPATGLNAASVGDCSQWLCDGAGNAYQVSDPADAQPPATTCAGLACGPATDNCGNGITCPNTCVAPETCGGGGAGQNGCGCTPEPIGTTCLGATCGSAQNNCGAMVDCGMCPANAPSCSNGTCICAAAGAACGPGESCVAGMGCVCGGLAAASGPACGGLGIGACNGKACDCNGAAAGACGQGETCDLSGHCLCGTDVAAGTGQACPNADPFPVCSPGVGCSCQQGSCLAGFVCVGGSCECDENADCGNGATCQAGACKCGGNPVCSIPGQICSSGVCTCTNGSCEG